MMRIGVIATRLNGTDGVSLEVEKWCRVLANKGHRISFCAGELGGYASEGTHIPLLHFKHPIIASLNERATAKSANEDLLQLREEISTVAEAIKAPLRDFIEQSALDMILVENALTIPMNLPLGLALSALIEELGIPTIAHHHDFYWERKRFRGNPTVESLKAFFPPALPSIRHVTINTLAQRDLKERRGLDSTVVPNVHDFAHPPKPQDDFSADVRQTLGLSEEDLFILQPTRVIPRKGIELTLSLVSGLDIPQPRIFITHSAGDEGLSYWQWLQEQAENLGVEMRLIDEIVAAERGSRNGAKIYALWDIYPHADLVAFPSLYEGFGNALLEAIYFKRLTIVNRYPVYVADIAPLGFKFIELDGQVSKRHITETQELLNDKQAVKDIVEHNYAIAADHFSFHNLDQRLQSVLESF